MIIYSACQTLILIQEHWSRPIISRAHPANAFTCTCSVAVIIIIIIAFVAHLRCRLSVVGVVSFAWAYTQQQTAKQQTED